MSRLDNFTLESIFLLVPETIPNIYKATERYMEIIDNHHILKKLKNWDKNTNSLFINAIVEYDLQFLKYLNDTSINYFDDVYNCRWRGPGGYYESLATLSLYRYNSYLTRKEYVAMTRETYKKLDVQTFHTTSCIYNIGIFEKIPFPVGENCQCYKNGHASCKTGGLTFIHNNVVSVFTIDEEKVHHPTSIEFNDVNFAVFLVQVHNPIKIQFRTVMKNNIPVVCPEYLSIYNLEINQYETNFLITIDVDKYIYIGLDVIEFETYDEITEFTASGNGPCAAKDSKYIYLLSSGNYCELNGSGFIKLMLSDVSDENFHDENYWLLTMYHDLHALEMKARLL